MNHTETALQLATAGATISDIEKKLIQDGATESEFTQALEETASYYRTVSNFDPQIELGRAFARLNLIFLNGIKVQDFKTAMSAQKEINALLGLYKKDKKQPPEMNQIYDMSELLVLPEEETEKPKKRKKK